MLDIFVRAVNCDFGVFPSANDAVVPYTGFGADVSCEALDAVEVASFDSRIRRTDCNFLSLSKIPTVGNGVEDVQDIYVEDCSCVVPLVAGCCLSLL
jgi:hypothetical protein